MKLHKLIIAAVCLLAAATQAEAKKDYVISRDVLMDKIRGAWAGQIIGCSYGGPTEFKYATFIDKNVDIPWDAHAIKYWYDNVPGLYDDVYMDLTFVDVFAKEGLDAPLESFAKAFANAGYQLWHANLKARYNILYGGMPVTETGYWENNPHADDIDFQIEADYAGIMAPGMPNAATYYSDGIGHLMNYGDGWYGGVYVAAMYSLAFVSNDIEYVVKEALKTIPKGTRYYNCMSDVISWHKQYPEDWHITWALANDKYGWDIGCPDMVFGALNIDAVINSAYILIGLLYGEKDFYKTIDIATRCGQDSDCNPASAGGILATMLGYSGIPEYWKAPLYEVADRNFKYTDISFNKASELSFDQALQVIERNGGKVEADKVTIKREAPVAVRFEQGFTGHYPYKYFDVRKSVTKAGVAPFEGIGCVVKGNPQLPKGYQPHGYVAEIDVYLDGEFDKTVLIPVDGPAVPAEFYAKYNLPAGKHTVELKWKNKGDEPADLIFRTVLAYSDHQVKTEHK